MSIGTGMPLGCRAMMVRLAKLRLAVRPQSRSRPRHALPAAGVYARAQGAHTRALRRRRDARGGRKAHVAEHACGRSAGRPRVGCAGAPHASRLDDRCACMWRARVRRARRQVCASAACAMAACARAARAMAACGAAHAARTSRRERRSSKRSVRTQRFASNATVHQCSGGKLAVSRSVATA
eukprot:2049458-Prymnesium_polylepis.1